MEARQKGLNNTNTGLQFAVQKEVFMKKIIVLLVFLLVVASVYAFDLPSIKPKLPSFDIPTTSPYKAYPPTIPTPPSYTIKICDEGKTQCQNNNFQVCERNSWKVKQQCKFDEFCDQKNGCVKKQTAQPQLNIVKPVPELKIVEDVPYVAQVCREGDVKCSSRKTNSVMICQDNQWSVQQKCNSKEECVTGQGCVSKVTEAKFPDYSNYKPSIPAPTKSPVDLGCEKPGERTCMGSLLLTCKNTQLGLIWTDSQDCGKPEFCDNKKGCLLSQTTYVDIAIKKPKVVLDECKVGDEKCSSDKKEVLICSGGKWARKQLCGDAFVCENNKCVPKITQIDKVIKKPAPTSTEVRKILPEKIISVQKLEEKIKNLEEKINTLGDDQQLAQVDLQNSLQKMQQLLQTMSSVSKNMHDTTMAIVRNLGGSTSEEPQRQEESSKKKMSKEEINKLIEEVEEQQEILRDKRQTSLTYFQNVDQKMNQLYNTLSAITKLLGQEQGLGTTRGALTNEKKEREKLEGDSQELAKGLQENARQAREEYEKVLQLLNRLQAARTQASQIDQTMSEEERDVMEELAKVMGQSIEDMNEDKEYYLDKLEEYNTMGEELADYLGDLVDQSTALSQANNEGDKKDDKLINMLLNKIKEGNIEAVDQLLILISKKSKKEQTEIANKLISAMKELKQKQQEISEQLADLKQDKSQAQKLADLNKEMTDVSMSRKAVADMLRDTMQMQEEITETTKSVLDSQGRIKRQSARFEDKKEDLSLISKIKNFFGKLFTIEEETEAQPVVEQEATGQQCNQQGLYYGCNNPPYITQQSCAQPAIEYYSEEGYTDLSLNCCTQASWGWNCYINGEQPVCNQEGLYYGCNNPPYTTQQSCAQPATEHYSEEGYTDLSLNCCTQATWGWNCYINGEQPTLIQEEVQQELYYGCNNPPYTTAESCGQVGIQHYTEEGYAGISLDYCTQASWGWNCYFNEQTEQQPTQQSTTCNEQGLYYGCNNPPYTTPESCGQVGTQHYTNEGYTGVNLNCCTQASWGWNCYLNGQQAPAGSYVTTCVCTGDNCTPLEN